MSTEVNQVQSDGLRVDQRPLYPMEFELSQEEKMRLRGGLSLFIMSMSVPIVMLFELRYIMAAGRVGVNANPWLGLIGLVFLVIAGIFLQVANAKTKTGDRRGILNDYGWAFLFGLIAFVLNGWQVANHSMSTTDHYDATLIVAVSVADFYLLCALLSVLAARGRVKRIANGVRNYWGIQSNSVFWWFVTIVWLVIYVLMYWL